MVLTLRSDMRTNWSIDRVSKASNARSRTSRLRRTSSLTLSDPNVAVWRHALSLLCSRQLLILDARESATRKNLSRSNLWPVKYCRLNRVKASNRSSSRTRILLRKYWAREVASQDASMTTMRERWRQFRLSRISSMLLLTKKRSRDCETWSQPTSLDSTGGKQLSSSDSKSIWEINRSSKCLKLWRRSLTPRTNSAFTDASARRLLKWRRTL